MIKVGKGKKAHWVVNSWVPRSHPTIPNNPSRASVPTPAGRRILRAMSRLASHRFRRRLAWLGALAVVAGGVRLLVVLLGNTGHKVPQRSRPASRPARPAAAEAGPRSPRPSGATCGPSPSQFVETAVYRKNVDASWGMTTAELRQGLSRADWANGTIPVVPYSADAVQEVRWRLDYSYAKDVALKVAFYPKPVGGDERQVFDIELENHGTERLRTGSSPTGRRRAGRSSQNAQPGGAGGPRRRAAGSAAAGRGLAVRAGRC